MNTSKSNKLGTAKKTLQKELEQLIEEIDLIIFHLKELEGELPSLIEHKTIIFLDSQKQKFGALLAKISNFPEEGWENEGGHL